jgi:hypothetical protein
MQSEKQPSYWAAGWATFAGMMLILVGIFHAISGLAQVVDPDAYVTDRELRVQALERRVGDGST